VRLEWRNTDIVYIFTTFRGEVQKHKGISKAGGLTPHNPLPAIYAPDQDISYLLVTLGRKENDNKVISCCLPLDTVKSIYSGHLAEFLKVSTMRRCPLWKVLL